MIRVAHLLVGLASFAVNGSTSAGPVRHRLQPALFFFEPGNRAMLPEVRKRMERNISFNGHFSRSYVSCGVACGTYFFVDRWSGGVIVAPEGSPPREMVWDIETKRTSDVIRVTFGPSDGIGPDCTSQRFQLRGHRFVEIGGRTPIHCPK